MLSRALCLATAMLLIGFAAPSSLIAPASAQNLEAGKSPAQLFAGNCAVCHRSARGLLKSVPPGQLTGFLRQHYTTSSGMAQSMSAYVISNGAGGGRAVDDGLTRRGRDLSRQQPPTAAEPTDRQRPTAAERQQAQPAADGAPAEQPRRGRNSRRPPPAEAAPVGETQPPSAEAEQTGGQKQKKGRKNRRTQEQPKNDGKAEPSQVESTKPESAKSEPAKPEPAKETAPVTPVDNSKPAEAVKPEPRPEAKPEAPAATRADPVPPVTPAPAAPSPSTSEPAKPNAE